MEPSELVIGRTYFMCGYHHPRYPIPRIRTYVYIGKKIYEGQDEYYFKEPEAYYAADLVNLPVYEDYDIEDPENATQLMLEEEYLANIKDYNGLVKWLEKLSSDANARNLL